MGTAAMVPLGEITTKIGSGATPKGGRDAYRGGGTALVRSMNVFDGRFEFNELAFIDDTQASKLAIVAVQPGDVLLNITGASVARCCSVPASILPARVNQHVAIVRADPSRVMPRFLEYALTAPNTKARLLAMAQGGATREALTKEALESFEIPLPALDVQAKVVSVLLSIDLLIENCSRRTANLKESAHAIYTEWFADFRFPAHHLSDFAVSESGPLPAGWEERRLGDVATWSSGGTPKTSVAAFWGGDIPWITSGSLTSFLLDDSERRLTAAGVTAGSRLVPPDTLLFVVRGMSLAKEFRHGIADVPLAFGQDCKALIATDDIEPLYLAFAVAHLADRIQKMVEFAAHGTGKLSTDRLKDLLILVPPGPLQEDFVVLVDPIRRLMTTLRLQARVLKETKSILLPCLISEEVDCSSVDINVSWLAA